MNPLLAAVIGFYVGGIAVSLLWISYESRTSKSPLALSELWVVLIWPIFIAVAFLPDEEDYLQ